MSSGTKIFYLQLPVLKYQGYKLCYETQVCVHFEVSKFFH